MRRGRGPRLRGQPRAPQGIPFPEPALPAAVHRLIDVASIGDLLLDVTVQTGGTIRPGDDNPAAIRSGGGGQAANVCAWLAALGGRSRLIARVGADPAGDGLVAELERTGVEVRAVRSVDEPTGTIVALVAPDGERTFLTQRGAAPGLRPGDVRDDWLADVALLHLPLYSLFEEPLAAAARHAASRVGRLAVDLSSAAGIARRGAAHLRDELRRLRPELLFANEAEAQAIGGNLEELSPLPLVKLGPRGCRVSGRDVPAPRVRALDSTGAGDAFAAAFMLARLRGAEPLASAEAAVAAGARAASTLGARP